ncbi:MAG TPA: hypothetical protein VFX58_15985 [Chitinophagaceae bacterium]|nr:hypothetical protein [Chitinophagaceae bacterium]
MTEFIYLLAWFILPLIPAFLLFKFLPSVGNLEGPFKGMQLKFGGAFAGYLVLFVVSKGVTESWMKKADTTEEVWTIKGDIVSRDDRFDVREDKPQFQIDPQGQRFQMRCFDVKVVATADAKGYLSFPLLTLSAYNYKQCPLPVLDFDKTKKNIDTAHYTIVDYRSRIIKLKNKLELVPQGRPVTQVSQVTNPDLSEIVAVDTTINQ